MHQFGVAHLPGICSTIDSRTSPDLRRVGRVVSHRHGLNTFGIFCAISGAECVITIFVHSVAFSPRSENPLSIRCVVDRLAGPQFFFVCRPVALHLSTSLVIGDVTRSVVNPLLGFVSHGRALLGLMQSVARNTIPKTTSATESGTRSIHAIALLMIAPSLHTAWRSRPGAGQRRAG